MNINLKVSKSIVGSVFFKLSSALISFISVPLLLKTLGTDHYAIWVTITALIGWLNIFDFGSGYSLKNKVTESFAQNNISELKGLVAGTIQFYLMTAMLLLVVFGFSLLFVKIFQHHLYLTLIIFIPVILSFPFTLGHFIIQGIKKFNLFNLILFSQSFVWLLIIYVFHAHMFKVDLETLAYCYSISYVIANFIIIMLSLKAIKFEWREILHLPNFAASKKSLITGSKFFVLQVSSLFLFSLGNILTYNNLTLQNVAQYDTINKIYVVGITLFNVVITVLWTEISHAKALNDKNRLHRIYNQLLVLAGLYSAGSLLVTFYLPEIIGLWTSHNITITLPVLYPFVLLNILQVLAYCGAVFLNAFEQLKGQIIFSVISAILMIPLSQLLFHYSVGIGSVPLSTAILTLPAVGYLLIKAKMIIKDVK
jgi:O-antigen/teichoic acid export membrane protein